SLRVRRRETPSRPEPKGARGARPKPGRDVGSRPSRAPEAQCAQPATRAAIRLDETPSAVLLESLDPHPGGGCPLGLFGKLGEYRRTNRSVSCQVKNHGSSGLAVGGLRLAHGPPLCGLSVSARRARTSRPADRALAGSIGRW